MAGRTSLNATELRDHLTEHLTSLRNIFDLTPEADEMVTHWLGSRGVQHPSLQPAPLRMSTDPPEIVTPE